MNRSDDPWRVDWRERAGRILLDPNGPDGRPIPTPLDRRWLWRIESDLAVSAANDGLRQLARDIRAYLNETCEHHWSEWRAADDIPAHRQCLWCCDVDWIDEGTEPVAAEGWTE
jgi:hypothetical protein